MVITDETDHVLVKKRMPNELTAILALLEPHRDELIGVVVASTYNWYWLVDGLQAAGSKLLPFVLAIYNARYPQRRHDK